MFSAEPKFRDENVGDASEHGDEIEGVPLVPEVVLQVSDRVTSLPSDRSPTLKPNAMIFRILSTVNNAVNVVFA